MRSFPARLIPQVNDFDTCRSCWGRFTNTSDYATFIDQRKSATSLLLTRSAVSRELKPRLGWFLIGFGSLIQVGATWLLAIMTVPGEVHGQDAACGCIFILLSLFFLLASVACVIIGCAMLPRRNWILASCAQLAFLTVVFLAWRSYARAQAYEVPFGSPSGVAIDSRGNVYVVNGTSEIGKVTAAGELIMLRNPALRSMRASAVTTDRDGNLYVADTENRVIQKITPAGFVSTLTPQFQNPNGVAVDGTGNIYVADYANSTIHKITAERVTTVAGLMGVPGSADGIRDIARFRSPIGIATDLGGNVYVADSGNNSIRKITPAGVVSTLAGPLANLDLPAGVAVDRNGNVYVADTGNSAIRRISPGGIVTTFAGLTRSRGLVDGIGNAARFYFPTAVATDSQGNVYVADGGNHAIRKITVAREVTTLAGSRP